MEFSVKMQPEIMMRSMWVILGIVILLVSVVLFVVIIKLDISERLEKA